MTSGVDRPVSLVRMMVNGEAIAGWVEPRRHLADFLRETAGVMGARIGCEHGVCGACAVVVEGVTLRGCLMLAVQAEGCEVRTIEGCGEDAVVSALQDAFVARNAMQCGFCTAGMILTAAELLHGNPAPSRVEIRDYLSGNYCRCTGYHAIVDAVEAASRALRNAAP